MSGSEHSIVDAAAGQTARQGWRGAIEQTVTGLGYELVDVERSTRGLLRVFIDRLPERSYTGGEGEFVTVDDCEQVTRQLQYALEVESVAYERLEVSSPGLDRPLRRPADYERFAGQEISLTLKLPFQGRKVWNGLLGRDDQGWYLELVGSPRAGRAGRPPKATGQSGKATAAQEGKTEQRLDFTLDEVREARLVPVVDFKGRTSRKAGAGSELGGQDR